MKGHPHSVTSYRVLRWVTTAMLVLATAACDDPRPPRLPRAAILRDAPVVLYRAADPTRPPRAVIFFFGNDVGFWKPHQALAWELSGMQYAVAGFDIRRLLAKLPDASGGRDSVFASTMRRLIDAARAELGPTPPLILAGHSIGSELALWTAAHVPLHGLTGVLALSPGSRSHLDISASDLLMSAEPTGPLSFSVAEQIRAIPSSLRIAIVRGQRDQFIFADSALLIAGRLRARRYLVPFSGHSLKSGLVAQFGVRQALEWILAGSAAAAS